MFIAVIGAVPTGMPRAAALVAAAALAAGVSACDPCTGIVGCDADPRISVEGTLVNHQAREPAGDVEVLFERTGGVELVESQATARSDAGGRFRLEMEAAEGGEVVGTITVRPPDRPSYTVPNVRFETVDRRGDGNILPQRWVVDPYLDFLGELYSGATGRPVGVHSEVTFRPKSGIEIEPDSFVAKTDFDGRFIIAPPTLGHGEVTGDLIFRGVIDGQYRIRTIPDVTFSTTHVERPLAVRGVWYFGLSMDYYGELRYRAQGLAAANVAVHFRRTGGIEVEPDSFSVITDANGRFPLHFEPAEPGVLVGDLTFEMGPPVGTVTFTDLEIPTLDVLERRRFESWSLGPGLNYVGEVRGENSGDAITGATVRLVRKSGIDVVEEVYVDTVDENGRFRMMPFPLGAGELVADLIIDLPDPAGEFTVEVQLETFESDELRLAGVWYVPGL